MASGNSGSMLTMCIFTDFLLARLDGDMSTYFSERLLALTVIL